MQAPNVYPFPQPQLQQLPRFQYAPTQLVLDQSAPRVDPLQAGVAVNPALPMQHYNIHSTRSSDNINNYAYYYHHPDNNDNTTSTTTPTNNINNNNNPTLPVTGIPVPNSSLYRNTNQFPSAPQRLLSIIPDPHMAPNISHYQPNNIRPQMRVSIPHNIHFQQFHFDLKSIDVLKLDTGNAFQ